MAVTLTLAAARRVGAAERFLRAGKFFGWLPGLFLGELLLRKTVGVIGAGRIGSAYAQMMVQAFKMDLLYYDLRPNPELEGWMADYSRFLEDHGEAGLSWEHTPTVEDLLERSDVVSIHTLLDDSTFHLINKTRLGLMKPLAILVNTSRGPVVDEAALAAHLKSHPDFTAGLDVFENEPALAPGLAELENAVIVPHIASATRFSRQGMAVLAARNVAAILNGRPAWNQSDIRPFLTDPAPPGRAQHCERKRTGPGVRGAPRLGASAAAPPFFFTET